MPEQPNKLVEIYADPVQQLGMLVDVLKTPGGEATYGIRLIIPSKKCDECGHAPDHPQASVEWILAPTQPYILGEAEAFCGGFKFGLQRPAAD